jgi:hypothetical protein
MRTRLRSAWGVAALARERNSPARFRATDVGPAWDIPPHRGAPVKVATRTPEYAKAAP